MAIAWPSGEPIDQSPDHHDRTQRSRDPERACGPGTGMSGPPVCECPCADAAELCGSVVLPCPVRGPGRNHAQRTRHNRGALRPANRSSPARKTDAGLKCEPNQYLAQGSSLSAFRDFRPGVPHSVLWGSTSASRHSCDVEWFRSFGWYPDRPYRTRDGCIDQIHRRRPGIRLRLNHVPLAR